MSKQTFFLSRLLGCEGRIVLLSNGVKEWVSSLHL